MSGAFSLPYSGTGVANAPTHLFKLDNNGSGFTAQFLVSNVTNPNGGLSISNLGLGMGIFIINSNSSNSTPTIKAQSFGTGFAGEFLSTNATPKALKTTGGLQLTGIGEAANKFLTSDASGNATWSTLPTKTYYYNASNLDFLPNTTATATWNAFTRDHENTRIAYFATTMRENTYMLAPVDLPDGSVITRLKAFYIDDNNLETLLVDLIRRQKITTTIPLASEDIMATVQSAASISPNVRTVQDNTISNSTIDNNIYHYFIKVKIGDCSGCDLTQNWRDSSLGIRAVELQYTN